MTSNQAAKDRQIYDDYVRLCRDIQDDLKSVVGRSQVILSLSIATLRGRFSLPQPLPHFQSPSRLPCQPRNRTSPQPLQAQKEEN